MALWQSSLVLALVLFAACAGVLWHRRSRSRSVRGVEHWPFHARPLMTGQHQLLYHRLAVALPDHLVFAQVQLAKLLALEADAQARDWGPRVGMLSLDYVVCKRDFSVVAAIELGDGRPAKASRLKARERKERALSAAGIRIIDWQTNALPDAHAIRNAIRAPQKTAGPVIGEVLGADNKAMLDSVGEPIAVMAQREPSLAGS